MLGATSTTANRRPGDVLGRHPADTAAIPDRGERPNRIAGQPELLTLDQRVDDRRVRRSVTADIEGIRADPSDTGVVPDVATIARVASGPAGRAVDRQVPAESPADQTNVVDVVPAVAGRSVEDGDRLAV